MQFVGKVISSVSEFYRDINPSTLSGAIDVIVVEDVESGELACSPFHVRFGKLQLLRPQEKAVELRINGGVVDRELMMKVGEAGETFFVLSREELGGAEGGDLPSEYLTSPLIGPETPVPLEQIEEFKLSSTSKPGNSNDSNSSINTNASNTANNTDGPLNVPSAVAAASAQSIKSPEWKWEWGDLPMKKKQPSEEEDNRNNNSSIRIEKTTTTTTTIIVSDSVAIESSSSYSTVELYEYLCGKEYLEKCFEEGGFSRFPPRSMICRIYRVDRGLHFHTTSVWPQELPQLLNESARLIESDFLLNPNVVIEESSRLVYQFSWENRRVCFSGSVGAAVVFYAQTYARILPLEIVNKLAEIAALRLAKRKFSKSKADEDKDAITEAGADNNNNNNNNNNNSSSSSSSSNSNVKVDDSISVNNDKKVLPNNLNSSENIQSTQSESIIPSSIKDENINNYKKSSNSGSGWRSWWSRSSINNASNNTNAISNNDATSTTATNIGSNPNNNTSGNQDRPVVPEENVRSMTGSPAGSPKLVNKLEQLVVSAPPATLSALVNDSTDLDKSPTKRIIQRTTSIGQLSNFSDTSTQVNNSINPPQSSQNTTSSASSINNTNRQYIKSLRLPSHLLKRLNLKPGVNTITYTVNTRLQGTATCQSRIFLWRSDARVVISDIDGTITKSDALGHLFTMVGKDWTHVGVAQLYSKIAGNGYEFLYLTSRAIGQAASTRGYLKAVEQDRLQLPDGPVIMSPDRLFTALHREVIQRRPDEFKIACLRDIQKLFVPDEEEVSMMGSGVISSSEDEYGGIITRKRQQREKEIVKDSLLSSSASQLNSTPSLSIISSSSSQAPSKANPFYAGFGNRPTDTKSYKAVGISASRIFLINPAGDLKLDKLTFYTPYSASSYSKLTEEVDKVFPPVRSPSSLVRVAGDEAFTDFQYWHGQGGDVRMDLVQEALGSVIKDKIGGSGSNYNKLNAIANNNTNVSNTAVTSSILVDEKGKPVSPVTLQLSLEEREFYKLKSAEIKVEKSGEEADSEAEMASGDSHSSSDSNEEVLESMDSFPFI